MDRPFVVCHMLTSLDGKIDGEFFSAPEALPARTEYAALRSFYHCQATLYGTTTLLRCYAEGTVSVSPEHAETDSKEDYVNKESLGTGHFIVSVDPEGVLKWSSNVLAKKGRPAAHIIEALTERAAPSYLCYLRRLGISYVFAGKARRDCALLLQKLRAYFDIRRLMLAGGGTMNWSFLQEGLIDELSLVIAPVADGNTTSVSILERSDILPPHKPVAFTLKEAKPLDGDSLWLCYSAAPHERKGEGS